MSGRSRRLVWPACLSLVIAVSVPMTAAELRSTEITESQALANFDFVWETIRDTHFDPQLNGVDWNAVRNELRPRAERCRDIVQLRRVLGQMLGRLGQSHFGIIPSGGYAVEFETPLDAAIEQVLGAIPVYHGLPGVGLDVRAVDGRILVTEVDAETSAARERIREGWSVETIDGHDMRAAASRLRKAAEALGPLDDRSHALHVRILVGSLLAGDEGTRVQVTFEDGAGRTVSRDLVREARVGKLHAVAGMPPLPVRVDSRVVVSEPGMRIGLVRIRDFWLPQTVAAFERALEQVAGFDGLIVDIRGNLGGVSMAAQGVAGYLAQRPFSFGSSIGRRGEFPMLVSPRVVDRKGLPYRPPTGPIAVLVDGESASSSELLAAGVQDAGVARLFGQPSAGAALPATISEMPSGDRLLHATHDFVRAGGQRIEAHPVRPDELVPWARADLLAQKDAAVEAAVRWIRGRLVSEEEKDR